MRTIFIQEKPVIICREINASIRHQITERQLILMKEPDLRGTALLHALKDKALQGYVWESTEPDALFDRLMEHYQLLQAAGGLLTNPGGDILLIFRRGKWDLPKGKMEAGESPEDTALRETTEETGLNHIEIESQLTETWHAYDLYGKNQMKQTHWFKMNFSGTELTVPQIEEEITDIQWIRAENISKYIPYAYPSLRDVFLAAGLPM